MAPAEEAGRRMDEKRQSRKPYRERSDKIASARRWLRLVKAMLGKSSSPKQLALGLALLMVAAAPMGRRAKTARPWPSTQSAPCASRKYRRRHQHKPLCWLLASLSARASLLYAAFQVLPAVDERGAHTVGSYRPSRSAVAWKLVLPR